ncbi:hypothetical protein CHARACLAT_016334 [Characodon lateralis]|uniref:Uncharacterized protein n=1 Tax=Characodon lateralis TaxID=208331 RepID=A0ABU7DH59_9TELE|nr:hypothetical protein [Characodon lateralis]
MHLSSILSFMAKCRGVLHQPSESCQRELTTGQRRAETSSRRSPTGINKTHLRANGLKTKEDKSCGSLPVCTCSG